MKRVLFGWILVLVGAFLLTVALLLWFVAPGIIEKTPKNTDLVTYVYGHAEKLNPRTGKVEGVPVKIWNDNAVNPARSTGTVAVFISRTCANVNRDNPPRCLRKSDNRLITNDVEVFAVDRHTGMSVPDQTSYGATAHSGLVNKFPFGTTRRAYPFWDNVVHQAYPARYAGTVDVRGLQTYKFVVRVPKTKTFIVQGVKGTYQLVRTMWVEPITGSIVDQTRHEVRLLPDGTTVIDLHDHFSRGTVAAFVDGRKSDISRLHLYETVAPIVSCVLGVLLLVAGLFLALLRGEPGEPSHEPQREPVTTA